MWVITALGSVQVVGFFDVAARFSLSDGLTRSVGWAGTAVVGRLKALLSLNSHGIGFKCYKIEHYDPQGDCVCYLFVFHAA